MACTTGRYPHEEIALHYAPVHRNENTMSGSYLPQIAIVLGDSAGIGPEIALKAARAMIETIRRLAGASTQTNPTHARAQI